MSIDTLQISKDLIKAGLEQNVAENLAHHFKKQEEEFLSKKEAEEKLATKNDIEEVKLNVEEVKYDVEKLKYNVEEVKFSIEKLKLTTEKDIAKAKSSIIMWNATLLTIQFAALVSFFQFVK